MSTDQHHAIDLLSRVRYGRLATSVRAMPFVAPARHLVDDGAVLLRMHSRLSDHRACSGSVVAYSADNLGSGASTLWSVQFTGTARIDSPTAEQLAAFGPAPRRINGEEYIPVYLRIDPRFATVHTLEHSEAT
ncbi:MULTISPECIES: pyridoxamine 5'-phosphate oxidase family protein [unclassified Streptomyces]|uniref:pyridoxamine 5'-phosphate oxidase family protein n=1 Tax=unclassified Streptomyces TaxID=2593676 RepID=UPI003825B4AB